MKTTRREASDGHTSMLFGSYVFFATLPDGIFGSANSGLACFAQSAQSGSSECVRRSAVEQLWVNRFVEQQLKGMLGNMAGLEKRCENGWNPHGCFCQAHQNLTELEAFSVHFLEKREPPEFALSNPSPFFFFCVLFSE